jgi:predicted PurR-regulated permease PerM
VTDAVATPVLPRDGGSGDARLAPIAPVPVDAEQAVRVNPWAEVPWRTIVGAVGVVVVTVATIELVLSSLRVVGWVAVAGFFAIVLAPLVKRVEQRIGGRRSLATGIVVVTTLASVIGIFALFLLPVRSQLINAVTDLPGTVQDAATGRGPAGQLVKRLHLVVFVRDHEKQLSDAAKRLNNSQFELAQAAFSVLIESATVTILTFLFLSQSSAMGRALSSLVAPRWRRQVRRVAIDAAAAVSGYMIGNLLVSLVAGTTAFVCLAALGVPNPVVLALWVAFADLIPLVGATIGAAVAVLAAFLESTPAGVVSLVFFVVYQQVENGAIYPAIMARTVKVNPLVVLLSVLLGVELFGVIGALLAVPLSGALLVLIKAVRRELEAHRASAAAARTAAA